MCLPCSDWAAKDWVAQCTENPVSLICSPCCFLLLQVKGSHSSACLVPADGEQGKHLVRGVQDCHLCVRKPWKYCTSMMDDMCMGTGEGSEVLLCKQKYMEDEHAQVRR